ncbi:MAG: N-acetyltransferase [Candidatus Omnitrophota bacterium]|jgi:amino-acid N-acetyltransferase
MVIRKGKITDVKRIQELINHFARKDLMLARSLNELYENIRDFWVAEEKNRLIGCCALHVSWDDLVEIKSLAVAANRQRRGIGKELVSICLEEASSLGAKRVFALSYKPEFFRKLGFRRIKNSELPHKIWAECINCCKFPDCQEVALLKKLSR